MIDLTIYIKYTRYTKRKEGKTMEKDFEEIYNDITEQLAREDSDYARAYADFWTARENLCRRFGMDWEDEDLERIMDGVLALEKDLGRRMFDAGMEFAKRGRKL